MASPLCGTGLYANDVLCEVIGKMDEIFASSNETLTASLAAVAAFQASSEDAMNTVTEIDYEIATDGIPVDYTPSEDPVEPDYTGTGPVAPVAPELSAAPGVTLAPTIPAAFVVPSHTVQALSTAPDAYNISDHVVTAGPTVPASYSPTSPPSAITPPTAPTAYDPSAHAVDAAPTVPDGYVVPDADQLLIDTAVSDDIFDRASAKLSRLALASKRKSAYSLASKGIGLASVSLLARMKEADQELTDKLSESALEQAVTEGNWYREDAKTIHDLHIKNWPLKPKADLDSYKAKEDLDIEAYKALLDASIRAWDVSPRFELDLYKAQQGVEQDGWKALQDFNIRSWSLKPALDVDVYKVYESLKADTHQATTSANIQNWPMAYELEIKAHQSVEPLKVDAYKTETSVGSNNWGESPKLQLQAWESFDKLSAELYSTKVNSEATHYQASVSGFTAEVQSTLGLISESTKRFNARVDLLQKHIASEAERRGWSQMQMGDAHEQADKATAYAIQKANAILEVTRSTTEEVAKLLVGLSQGMWSAQGYSLRGSGSQSVSESV